MDELVSVIHPNNRETYAQRVTPEQAVKILIELMNAGYTVVIDGLV